MSRVRNRDGLPVPIGSRQIPRTNRGTAGTSNHWSLGDQFVITAAPTLGDMHLVGVGECTHRPSNSVGRLLTMNVGLPITAPGTPVLRLLTRVAGLEFLTGTVLNLLVVAHVGILLI